MIIKLWITDKFLQIYGFSSMANSFAMVMAEPMVLFVLCCPLAHLGRGMTLALFSCFTLISLSMSAPMPWFLFLLLTPSSPSSSGLPSSPARGARPEGLWILPPSDPCWC